MNPSSQFQVGSVGATLDYNLLQFNSETIYFENSFIGVLGHNCKSANAKLYATNGANLDLGSGDDGINFKQGPDAVPEYDGFTLYKPDEASNFPEPTDADGEIRIYFTGDGAYQTDLYVNCVCIGNFYDMKNAPNLSLSLEHQYGGTKEITTHNGSSMSNTMWSKPAKWGNLGAWELGTSATLPHQLRSRSGRRVWQLSWSFMDDGDLFGSNQMLSLTNNTSGLTYNPTTDIQSDGTKL